MALITFDIAERTAKSLERFFDAHLKHAELLTERGFSVFSIWQDYMRSYCADEAAAEIGRRCDVEILKEMGRYFLMRYPDSGLSYEFTDCPPPSA